MSPRADLDAVVERNFPTPAGTRTPDHLPGSNGYCSMGYRN